MATLRPAAQLREDHDAYRARLPGSQDDLAHFIEDFVANTHGPTKWEKLAEFLKEAYPAMANEVGAGQVGCALPRP